MTRIIAKKIRQIVLCFTDCIINKENLICIFIDFLVDLLELTSNDF